MEFDQYARNYNAGMDNRLKRLVGDNANEFVEIKVRWLLQDIKRRLESYRSLTTLHLLDYGCGVGTFLKILRRRGFSGQLSGCDISQRMLEEAELRWEDAISLPQFQWLNQKQLPYHDAVFDIIIVSAVLHHIPVEARKGILKEIARVLKPKGWLYIFEHNLYNPITRWVVKHTPIDRGALLMSAGELHTLLMYLPLTVIRTEYLMFFPPRWHWLWFVEDYLRWMPLGGQFVVVGQH